MRSPLLFPVALLATVLAASCGGGGGGTPDPSNPGGNPGGGGNGGGGGGGGGGGIPVPDTCTSLSAQASLGKLPVDVVFVVDNSASMTHEIIAIEKNINTHFAQIIGAAGLDYRVILISKHGSSASQEICVSQPLSGRSCADPSGPPVNGERFFHFSPRQEAGTPAHGVDSSDSFDVLRDTFASADEYGFAPQGWSGWLRANAYKVFLEITDDDNLLEPRSAADFDAVLRALSPTHFGTAAKRNYRFHAIVGVPPKADPAAAYGPTEPLLVQDWLGRGKCNTAENTGEEHQKLAMLTGGLRFPVCETERYDTVFRNVAEGVISGAQVGCEFTIPQPPAGLSIDRIMVEYTPGQGGPVQAFDRVADASACTGNAFYSAAGKVTLCPGACQKVQADPAAKLSVKFTCDDGAD